MRVLDRSGSIFFCDDLREEKSGMKTMVGIYTSDLEVDAFPYAFPRLTAYASFSFDIVNPLKSFSIKIYADDDLVIDHPAPASFIESTVGKTIAEGRASGFLNTTITLVNTEVDSPCILHAVAEIDGVEYEVNRLKISEPVTKSTRVKTAGNLELE